MTPTTELQTTDVVTQRAITWPETARAIAIVDDGSYLHAAEMVKGIKALRAEVDEAFDSIIAKANAAHKEACAKKRAAETPLIEAERLIKAAMGAFDEAQERIRRAEQQRLEDEERRRVEEDRINLAAHMETEGKAFGDEGIVAEAHELINQPIVPVVAPVVKAVPKVQGVTYRDVYKFQVVNPQLVPRQYCIVNESAIRSVVNGLKGEAVIPGVRIWKERAVAVSK